MRRSVLMISGSTFADVAICAQTRQLAKAGRYRFSALGMSGEQGRPGALDLALFEQVAPFPLPDLQPRSRRAGLALAWDFLRCATAWRAPWLDAKQVGESAPTTWRERIRYRIDRKKWASTMPMLAAGHDLCHWHTLNPHWLPALDFIPSAIPVVLTVWGSDILRTSGLEMLRRQIRACERADCVTVNSLEMREFLLARVGRQFEGKVRFASFGSDLYDPIDRAREARSDTLERLGVSPGKVTICVGNNGSPSNQHVAILRAIAGLSETLCARIAVVLPLGYGTTPDYLTVLREAAAAAPFETHLIDRPLARDEVAGLRSAAAILVHLPVTDAFSATMCEHLYGGSVLITGAWLPYGPLRRRGVHHHVVDDPSQLPERLEFVLEHLADERHRTAAGAAAVRELASWESVAQQWLAIYDELTASLPR